MCQCGNYGYVHVIDFKIFSAVKKNFLWFFQTLVGAGYGLVDDGKEIEQKCSKILPKVEMFCEFQFFI